MAENQSGFSGYTASAHCKPEYNFAHNLRITDSVYNQEHIGVGEHENWLGGDEIDPRLLFNQIFEEPVKKYNETQKRSDRKIKDYYQRVLDDGRFGKTKTLKIGNKQKIIDTSKKPIYEFIIQIGNREEHPDSAGSKKVLKSFITDVWDKKFGKNFKLVRVDYHDDEYSQDKDNEYTIKSPAHIHVAFVPVVQKNPEELKGKGVFKLELQHSLSQACEQAGFKTDHLTDEERAIKNELKANIKKAKENGDKELKEQLQEQLIAFTTYTSQQRFEEAVRFAFADHCRENGIEIDLTPGKKHSHQNKQLYQINQEQKKLEEVIEKKQQLENSVNSKIEELKTDMYEFEQKKQSDLNEIQSEKEKLESDKSDFEIKKQSDLDEIEEARTTLQTDKDSFEEDKKKAEKILEKENAVEKAHKEIETWQDDRKKAEEYVSQFDFDASAELLNDSKIKSTPEALEESFPVKRNGFSKETYYEYGIRVRNNLWGFAKKVVKNFQEKYNHLKEAVKTLFQENLKLKRENQELKDNHLKVEIAVIEKAKKDAVAPYEEKLSAFNNFLNDKQTTIVYPDGFKFTCLTGKQSIRNMNDELVAFENLTPYGFKNLAERMEKLNLEDGDQAYERMKKDGCKSIGEWLDKPIKTRSHGYGGMSMS